MVVCIFPAFRTFIGYQVREPAKLVDRNYQPNGLPLVALLQKTKKKKKKKPRSVQPCTYIHTCCFTYGLVETHYMPRTEFGILTFLCLVHNWMWRIHSPSTTLFELPMGDSFDANWTWHGCQIHFHVQTIEGEGEKKTKWPNVLFDVDVSIENGYMGGSIGHYLVL